MNYMPISQPNIEFSYCRIMLSIYDDMAPSPRSQTITSVSILTYYISHTAPSDSWSGLRVRVHEPCIWFRVQCPAQQAQSCLRTQLCGGEKIYTHDLPDDWARDPREESSKALASVCIVGLQKPEVKEKTDDPDRDFTIGEVSAMGAVEIMDNPMRAQLADVYKDLRCIHDAPKIDKDWHIHCVFDWKYKLKNSI